MKNERPARTEPLGELLQEVVNHVSHGPQGQTLAIMSEASVTLLQVLMLRRLIERKAGTPSALAHSLNMSPPAVSQMLERLFQLGLIQRTEDPDDRRKRRITATPKAKWLVKRLSRARSVEYGRGVSRLSSALRKELATVLSQAVTELRALGDAERNEDESDQAGTVRVVRADLRATSSEPTPRRDRSWDQGSMRSRAGAS
jgi:DNA-binding MarR family transcriptional regulator